MLQLQRETSRRIVLFINNLMHVN